MDQDSMRFIVTKKSRQVCVYTEEQINDKAVILEECIESAFYLLGVPKSVTIERCDKSLVVIPACKGSIFYRNSKHGTVFACCQQFRSKKSDFIFHGYVTTDPIIENCNAVFQEITSVIPGMDEWRQKAGLHGKLNKTKQVRDFTPDESTLLILPQADALSNAYLPEICSNDCVEFEKKNGIILVGHN